MIQLTPQKPTVFISGSAKIKNLNEEMCRCLDNLMKRDVRVIVGDCYGVDILAQKYLKNNGFEDVTVYTSTETPRRCEFPNFVSMWKQSQGKTGEDFYQVKDREMCNQCDEAIAFWNGVSYGVKCNIDRLKAMNKPTTVIIDQTWLPKQGETK
jgi:hypothetical protein